jgi:hypothetical protein
MLRHRRHRGHLHPGLSGGSAPRKRP